MARKRKLKMTKKCIAARRCYRARKRGVPARKKRGAGFTDVFERLGINTRVVKNRVRPKKSGAGLRKRKKTRRGAKGAKGAGFWEDVGHTFETIGQTALQALPMIAML